MRSFCFSGLVLCRLLGSSFFCSSLLSGGLGVGGLLLCGLLLSEREILVLQVNQTLGTLDLFLQLADAFAHLLVLHLLGFDRLFQRGHAFGQDTLLDGVLLGFHARGLGRFFRYFLLEVGTYNLEQVQRHSFAGSSWLFIGLGHFLRLLGSGLLFRLHCCLGFAAFGNSDGTAGAGHLQLVLLPSVVLYAELLRRLRFGQVGNGIVLRHREYLAGLEIVYIVSEEGRRVRTQQCQHDLLGAETLVDIQRFRHAPKGFAGLHRTVL